MSKYGKYVVTDLKQPPDRAAMTPLYEKYAKRILWMDKDVVPGAFNMNTAWYLKAGPTLDDKPHTHAYDEIIGFFSSDSTKPNDLGGVVEIYLEDELQVISKSAMIFVPAGMVHCPLYLRRVDRPIFHFTVVTTGTYIKDENKKQ
jgi:hypothetical protein